MLFGITVSKQFRQFHSRPGIIHQLRASPLFGLEFREVGIFTKPSLYHKLLFFLGGDTDGG
jgi:hypothetical protein